MVLLPPTLEWLVCPLTQGSTYEVKHTASVLWSNECITKKPLQWKATCQKSSLTTSTGNISARKPRWLNYNEINGEKNTLSSESIPLEDQRWLFITGSTVHQQCSLPLITSLDSKLACFEEQNTRNTAKLEVTWCQLQETEMSADRQLSTSLIYVCVCVFFCEPFWYHNFKSTHPVN